MKRDREYIPRVLSRVIILSTPSFEENVDPRRLAYRKAWYDRLLPELAPHEWRWSAEIAAHLGEPNEKVLERLRDLVAAGVVERHVRRLSGARKNADGHPMRAYFRLAIGKQPDLPPNSELAPRAPRRRRRPLATPPRSPVRPRFDPPPHPAVRRVPPPSAALPQSLIDAVCDFVIGVPLVERREILEAYDYRNSVPPLYDRPLLAMCGQRISRYLDLEEKRAVRALFIAGIRALV